MKVFGDRLRELRKEYQLSASKLGLEIGVSDVAIINWENNVNDIKGEYLVTDDCAYLVDDRVLSEGGYEPECFIEYNLKGPFKPGLDKKYTGGFKASFERIG